MREKHVGDVVVEERAGERFPVGIMTYRNLVVQAAGLSSSPSPDSCCCGSRDQLEHVIGRQDSRVSCRIMLLRTFCNLTSQS
jgi:hypothetical protein